MKPLGYVFLAFAAFLYYEGFKGRQLSDVSTDIADAGRSAITFDFDGIQEVWSREGTLTSPDQPTTGYGTVGEKTGYSTPNPGDEPASANGLKVLAAAHKRGEVAAGYRLGATGPQYYDCSGLIWRAMQDAKVYTGFRFVTATFRAQCSKIITEVPSPVAGDIIWWNGHMGIAESSTRMYHAASPKSGVRSESIAVMIDVCKRIGYGNVKYFRIK